MNLIFNVEKQNIIPANKECVVSDSREYVECVFVFSKDWEGTGRTVIFGGDNGDYNVVLGNSQKCAVPYEVLSGSFSVSVFGVKDSMRITTDKVYIDVNKSGFCEGEIPSEPTPEVYEQIISALASKAEAEQVSEAINKEKTLIEYSDEVNPVRVLGHNKEMRYGAVKSITLTLPAEIHDDYISSVIFTSGETVPTVIAEGIIMCGDECDEGIFEPEMDKRYTVIVSYDGVNVIGDVRGVSL